MKKILVYILLLLVLSCKKNENKYYDNGKPKYINIWENNFLKVSRYDRQGNLLFKGKYKDQQLFDTIYVFDKEDNYIIKIDSSKGNYFYGTILLKYSTGKDAKISHLRFKKNSNIDSIFASSLLFGKEVIFSPNGNLAKEAYYKIVGDSSILIDEKNYD
jgi:hypothetical protein